jgi:hypothetical protein
MQYNPEVTILHCLCLEMVTLLALQMAGQQMIWNLCGKMEILCKW